jgi:hypothetical protein
MDVYHRVLVKLYETTGGKDTETVDLKELVKKEGFLGAYPDIFQHMNRQSWISETARRDAVKITHWGVKEAKKSQTSETSEADGGQSVKKDINRTISETRELIRFLEDLANEFSEENITKTEKKLNEINLAIQKLKENV